MEYVYEKHEESQRLDSLVPGDTFVLKAGEMNSTKPQVWLVTDYEQHHDSDGKSISCVSVDRGIFNRYSRDSMVIKVNAEAQVRFRRARG